MPESVVCDYAWTDRAQKIGVAETATPVRAGQGTCPVPNITRTEPGAKLTGPGTGGMIPVGWSDDLSQLPGIEFDGSNYPCIRVKELRNLSLTFDPVLETEKNYTYIYAILERIPIPE